MMSSPVPPDRCGSADTAKSDDPLDGMPSEDARLTHVDSCSSLPEAGDDLIPCDRRNISQPNHQPGRNEEFGSETLMQLLANASTLLTSQDLALPPNDPRALLPTPFAPGQSARTLSEQELQRKRQQENNEWHALRSKTKKSPERANSPIVTKRELPLGRGRARPLPMRGRARSINEASANDPFFQQQRQPQPSLQQQQHILTNLQRQLSVGLMNRQESSPIQRMYPPNAPPLTFQQPNMNDLSMTALMGAGVGLGQSDAFGGSASNAVMNNLIPGFIPSMPISGASTFALAANNGIDRTGLNWLLPHQQVETPVFTTENRNHLNANAPVELGATTAATKKAEMGKSSDKSRPTRWAQRYNELLEFKRTEGVSCFDFQLCSRSFTSQLLPILNRSQTSCFFLPNHSTAVCLMDILPIKSYPGG